MTNIMSVIKNKSIMTYNYKQINLPFEITEEPFFDEKIGVVMADGLASWNGESTYGHQKVFPSGNNFILGTGGGDIIRYIAKELLDKNLPPKDLAEK